MFLCSWCKKEPARGLDKYRGDLCAYCFKDSMDEIYPEEETEGWESLP